MRFFLQFGSGCSFGHPVLTSFRLQFKISKQISLGTTKTSLYEDNT